MCVPVPIPDLKLRADEFFWELRVLSGEVVDLSPGELFGGNGEVTDLSPGDVVDLSPGELFGGEL